MVKYIKFHRDQKVKDLRIDPQDSSGELKLTWKDEEGVRHTAWIKTSEHRETRFFKDNGEIKK